MENPFFKKAFGKAADITARQHRLLKLVSQLVHKLQRTDLKNGGTQAIRSRLSVFGRISKAYALGHYRAVPWQTMLAIVASILYFVNPFDLVPDLIPLTGLTDDFAVLLWVYSAVNKEVEKFLAWERTRVTVL